MKLLTWLKQKLKLILWAVVALAVISLAIRGLSYQYQYWDSDKDRGATTVKEDIFGDRYIAIEYLEQGWKASESLWFYNITQGSDMLPYDFFMALEQTGKNELFRANDNINRYRYLPQKVTHSNPDGLPVGFVKDTFRGKDYLGFTCAACHTGQINYKGTAIRIDGGPSAADMETFLKDLVQALYATHESAEARQRFVRQVLTYGNYKTEAQVMQDLKKYTLQLAAYTHMNHSATAYGYYRLDAFGRIYNRVLEHIITPKQLEATLKEILSDAEMALVMKEAGEVLTGKQRDHLVERIATLLTPQQQTRLRDKLFNPANAPTSYPFLWDIAQHDYVQWNGIGGNAGLGPVGRNAGEVIGVFGTLDWKQSTGFSLPSFISGQGWSGTFISFESSIDVANLKRIEAQLKKLQSPLWPQHILPAINEPRVARGEKIFNRYCASCHAEIDRASPTRRVVANMTSIQEIGTDPAMAANSVRYEGYSGILRNLYVGAGVGDILLDQRAPVAALLTKATLSTVATPDPDKLFITRWSEWAYDLATTFFDNEIKSSIKRGNYVADTTVNPYASLQAYKGRSLNGIWATAPYLHNGSVPTLYDLLLPKKRLGDPKNDEYRPDEFEVGAREFDADKVGLKANGYKGFTFNTRLPGNSNAGHEYSSGHTPQPDGSKPPELSKEQRLDLLEYLKIL